MGSGQLSQVMQSVSRSVSHFRLHCRWLLIQYVRALTLSRDPSQHASLKAEIEAQSSSLYATARLWDDGIIKPTETRDVVGLGLALSARKGGSSAPAALSGSSATSWNGERGGRMGGFGVYRM
jgi:3-methylcrotonyl-CoA carboxylase beta subunit